jgi:tetratricopeptide (TPR) repeat protein
MQEREAGNDQQVAFFLPMGITAYRQAGPLDADGLYHLSLLEAAAGQNDAALATANQILSQNPTHLLGLAAAANAAVQQGDTSQARGYYQRFLQSFESEQAKPLPEYRDHAPVLPEYRRSAEAIVNRPAS